MSQALRDDMTYKHLKPLSVSAEQEQRGSDVVRRAFVARGERGDDHAADGPRPAEPRGARLLARRHLRRHVSHIEENMLKVQSQIAFVQRSLLRIMYMCQLILQSNTRSTRCPVHSDAQRKEVRLKWLGGGQPGVSAGHKSSAVGEDDFHDPLQPEDTHVDIDRHDRHNIYS